MTRTTHSRLARTLGVLLVLVFVLSLMPATASFAATIETSVPGGRYYGQTGYSVVDGATGAFYREFTALGGVNALGYPISVPFEKDGFTYQAFQRAILQWRPELNRCLLANTMDWLTASGKDDALAQQGIPAPLSDSSNGDFAKAVAERESWLTEPAIAQAYRQGGGYQRFGLPASRPERAGPFIIQRFQRYAFQYWLDTLPGMPAKGSVVGLLSGDIAKNVGLLPDSALVKPQAPGVAGAPAQVPAPAPAPPADTTVAVGATAPSFTMTTIDGQTVNLSDFRGRPVVLTLFGSWCPVCRNQFAAIEGVKRDNPDVVFLSVSNESAYAIKQYATSTGYSGVFARDSSAQAWRIYKPRGVPSNYFIDRDGIIREIVIGGMGGDGLRNHWLKRIK